MAMDRLEKLCADKGLRMTEPRRIIARVLSSSEDHPDAEELHRRANSMDASISLATVAPSLVTTNALGTSPHRSSGTAMTR